MVTIDTGGGMIVGTPDNPPRTELGAELGAEVAGLDTVP